MAHLIKQIKSSDLGKVDIKKESYTPGKGV
jgi:hypothetical protein